MEEIENGIRIKHEWLGREQVVTAMYENNRLTLYLEDREVCLSEGETAYFLAHMATWYEQNGD